MSATPVPVCKTSVHLRVYQFLNTPVMPLKKILIIATALNIVLVSVNGQSLLDAQNTKKSGWSAYGGDAGGTRYSGLQQINSENVKQLQVAWTYRTGELEKYIGTNAKEKAAFEATPILADHTLYFSTPSCRVFAIDASSGAQKMEL